MLTVHIQIGIWGKRKTLSVCEVFSSYVGFEILFFFVCFGFGHMAACGHPSAREAVKLNIYSQPLKTRKMVVESGGMRTSI